MRIYDLEHSSRRTIAVILLCISILFLLKSTGEARRECCSWHGGVAGCDRDVGRLVCNDGTYSPTCGCEKRNKWLIKDGKQYMPDNAAPNSYNDGWVCKQGYKQMGNACIEVQVPLNAHLNYSGQDWECDNDYRRSVNQCLKVQVPDNAHINYSGHDWECDNGYRRSGNQCLKVQLPDNAHINYSGHEWECDNGYRRNGNQCLMFCCNQQTVPRLPSRTKNKHEPPM
jgi:hypothetical protein